MTYKFPPDVAQLLGGVDAARAAVNADAVADDRVTEAVARVPVARRAEVSRVLEAARKAAHTFDGVEWPDGITSARDFGPRGRVKQSVNQPNGDSE